MKYLERKLSAEAELERDDGQRDRNMCAVMCKELIQEPRLLDNAEAIEQNVFFLPLRLLPSPALQQVTPTGLHLTSAICRLRPCPDFYLSSLALEVQQLLGTAQSEKRLTTSFPCVRHIITFFFFFF